MASIDAVFKAYDIRGRVDNGELDGDLVFAIGAAFAKWSAADRIAVGFDCRPSSPSLAESLIGGITSQGTSVVSLGAVPTDLVYYVSGAEGVPGVMITASHNPAGYNGIKLCGPGAAPIGEESGLSDIKRMVIDGVEPGTETGLVEPRDAVEDYIDHLFSIVDAEHIADLHVVVDGGNGMAGIAITRVFERLDARLDGLYLEPDGTFPNHPANPLEPENLVDLIDRVRETGADLGVAFDGDADRAFFVDGEGEVLSGSATTALIAQWFLRRVPGAAIVHNLITSRAVPEIIEEESGVPIRTRVGHSFIKAVMADTGAVFGGEHSGHYYFADNYRADSGVLAMLVLLQVLSESGKTLAELRASVERYASSGEVNLRVDDAPAAADRVEKAFPTARVDRMDGLTLSWDDRWLNLRPSNTEPFLRLNVEAADADTVTDLVRSVTEIVEGE